MRGSGCWNQSRYVRTSEKSSKHLFWQPRLRQGFPALLFLCLSHVAAAIPHFVSFEVRTIDTFYGFSFFATGRQRAFIAVLRMQTIIYFAGEVS